MTTNDFTPNNSSSEDLSTKAEVQKNKRNRLSKAQEKQLSSRICQELANAIPTLVICKKYNISLTKLKSIMADLLLEKQIIEYSPTEIVVSKGDVASRISSLIQNDDKNTLYQIEQNESGLILSRYDTPAKAEEFGITSKPTVTL